MESEQMELITHFKGPCYMLIQSWDVCLFIQRVVTDRHYFRCWRWSGEQNGKTSPTQPCPPRACPLNPG